MSRTDFHLVILCLIFAVVALVDHHVDIVGSHFHFLSEYLIKQARCQSLVSFLLLSRANVPFIFQSASNFLFMVNIDIDSAPQPTYRMKFESGPISTCGFDISITIGRSDETRTKFLVTL